MCCFFITFNIYGLINVFQVGHDQQNTQEQKPVIGVQNSNALSQLLSDQNQNINKSSPGGFSPGQGSKQNNSEGKHHHDQQRLTHEQVLLT